MAHMAGSAMAELNALSLQQSPVQRSRVAWAFQKLLQSLPELHLAGPRPNSEDRGEQVDAQPVKLDGHYPRTPPGLTAVGGGELPTQICPEADALTTFKANDLGTV